MQDWMTLLAECPELHGQAMHLHRCDLTGHVAALEGPIGVQQPCDLALQEVWNEETGWRQTKHLPAKVTCRNNFTQCKNMEVPVCCKQLPKQLWSAWLCFSGFPEQI